MKKGKNIILGTIATAAIFSNAGIVNASEESNFNNETMSENTESYDLINEIYEEFPNINGIYSNNKEHANYLLTTNPYKNSNTSLNILGTYMYNNIINSINVKSDDNLVKEETLNEYVEYIETMQEVLAYGKTIDGVAFNNLSEREKAIIGLQIINDLEAFEYITNTYKDDVNFVFDNNNENVEIVNSIYTESFGQDVLSFDEVISNLQENVLNSIENSHTVNPKVKVNRK